MNFIINPVDAWLEQNYEFLAPENIDPVQWLEVHSPTNAAFEWLERNSSIEPVEKWLEDNREFLAPGNPESLTDVQIKRLLDQELPRDELLIPVNYRTQYFCSQAIQWLVNKVLMNWRPETAYLSAMLLLRYASKVQMPMTVKHADILRLVTVTCMFLAVCLNNPRNQAVDFCLGCYSFSTVQIEKAAKVLVHTFGWETRLTNPFHFVPFLVNVFCPAASRANTVQRIDEIILALVTDVNIMYHRSSIVTLAVILHLICDPNKTKEQVVAIAKPAAEALGIRNVSEVAVVLDMIAAVDERKFR